MTARWSPSLQLRLVAAYVAALVCAMVLFGTGAVVVIHRDQYAALDARLRTTARAALNFIDVENGRITIDKKDRAELANLISPQANLALWDPHGSLVFAAGPPPPHALAQANGDVAAARDVSTPQGLVRAYIAPLSSTQRAGTLAAWTTTEWIGESDRRVAIAFAIAAAVLAVVSALASIAVTRRALGAALYRQERFAADASHDLRAPLSVIRAEADLALRSPRDPASYQATLASIAAEADQMERLVSALLSAARAADNRRSAVDFDLSTVAQRVCVRLQPAAKAKRIDLHCDAGEPLDVRADEDAVERALTAIVHNAIKYTHTGGRIGVALARRHNAVELSVHDDGEGFSAPAIAHGLEWYWSGEKNIDAGSGLGLAIANAIVRGNGGKLALANGSHGGAEVTITLPAR